MRKRHQIGLSMLELLIVLGVGMVLVAMVAPLVNTTINMYRLRGVTGEYANLLQRARIRAVTDDRYYPVYAATKPYAGSVNAFADFNNGNGVAAGTYAVKPTADPAVSFNSAVSVKSQASAPNINNLYTRFMPGIALTAVQINPNTWAAAGSTVVTFGARGLPCYLAAAPAPGSTCSYTWPGVTPQPIAFEVFMQNTRTNAWEAVTVNPSGRVREWRYNTSSQTWQPLD